MYRLNTDVRETAEDREGSELVYTVILAIFRFVIFALLVKLAKVFLQFAGWW